MVNTGHRQVQRDGEGTQAFIVRYIEIHEEQARSARSELDRLRSLIDDASERLLLSFSAIGAYTKSRSASVPDSVDAMTVDLGRAVDEAVSALQFQDMANQLVEHATQRIALLETITRSLGRLPEVSVDDLTDAVTAAACGRSAGPVEQACMAGGSVDLF